MISYLEALKKIKEIASKKHIEFKCKTENVDLLKSLGRITNGITKSHENVPSFNNSAMDGFVLVGKETLTATKEHPLVFEVVGEIAAGDWLSDSDIKKFSKSSCFEIMTGSPIPENLFDSVVRVEDVIKLEKAHGRDRIQISKPVPRGDQIRLKGTDIRDGQEILPAQTKINSEMILTAATCGISSIEVYKKPKVMVVSTGSELVDFNSKNLKPGKIRNSTGPYLSQKLNQMGCEVANQLFVMDKPELFYKQMKEALSSEIDLILTTGAVSMGKYDFIISVLNDMGAKIHFHKVAIRPGKPIVLAEIPVPNSNRTITFFGMPGNPVSTAVALRFFVNPYLLELQGQSSEMYSKGRVLNSIKKPDGLKCFYKAKMKVNDGIVVLDVPVSQASYLVGNFNEVDHWVLLPENGTQVSSGDLVEYCLI